MNNKKGKFIVFEGIDGSGKSTQIRLLAERLNKNGTKCIETREPTDSPVGSLIHQIMTGRMSADNRVIACLFAADRVDHLLNETDGILEKINSGITVISDRYYFSSYAYHGVDMDMDWVINTNSVSSDILRPDATIFMDISAKTAMERITSGRDHIELYEKEERLNAVREKYFEAFEMLKNDEKVNIVDASKSAEDISEEIWNIVSGINA
mgnify:CR=1 FL=1